MALGAYMFSGPHVDFPGPKKDRIACRTEKGLGLPLSPLVLEYWKPVTGHSLYEVSWLMTWAISEAEGVLLARCGR